MEQKALSDEMERTLKLLADLQGLRGRLCKRCESELCNHETLFSLSMGFKNAPLCCTCLAAELEREPVQMRDELWSFVCAPALSPRRVGMGQSRGRLRPCRPSRMPLASPAQGERAASRSRDSRKSGRVMRKRNLGRRRYGAAGILSWSSACACAG